MRGDATRRSLGADLPRLRRRILVNRQEVVNKISGALPLPGPAFSRSLDVWKRHKVSGAVVDSNSRDVSTALGSDALMKQSRFN